MTLQEIKQLFIDELFSRGVYAKQVSEVEYRTRCEFCGDSTKDLRTGHLYIRVDPDTPFNMPYNCFKCGTKGIVNKEFLTVMGMEDPTLVDGIAILNKKGKTFKNYKPQAQFIYFERNLPEEFKYPYKIEYIRNRMGIEFVEEDLKEMKVVTSLYDFLITNDIKNLMFPKHIAMSLERDYVGFLSSGNSHILFRDVTGKNKYMWVKYPIDKESKKNKVFYGLSDEVDIFSDRRITVNLCEGVMDAVGIKYHLMNEISNTVNIAVCGNQYLSMIKHLVQIGMYGRGVDLNIYMDNDADFNSHSKIKKMRVPNYLYDYKGLFNSVSVGWNLIGKDCGVKKEQIVIKKERI